jgi:hypothetical protein
MSGATQRANLHKTQSRTPPYATRVATRRDIVTLRAVVPGAVAARKGDIHMSTLSPYTTPYHTQRSRQMLAGTMVRYAGIVPKRRADKSKPQPGSVKVARKTQRAKHGIKVMYEEVNEHVSALKKSHLQNVMYDGTTRCLDRDEDREFLEAKSFHSTDELTLKTLVDLRNWYSDQHAYGWIIDKSGAKVIILVPSDKTIIPVSALRVVRELSRYDGYAKPEDVEILQNYI